MDMRNSGYLRFAVYSVPRGQLPSVSAEYPWFWDTRGSSCPKQTSISPRRARLSTSDSSQPYADAVERRFEPYRRTCTSVGDRRAWRRFDLANPELLIEAFMVTLDVKAIVVKRRHLLLLREVRIHLDEVVDLGCFVELGTTAQELDPPSAHAPMKMLRDAFEIAEEDGVAEGYCDMALGAGLGLSSLQEASSKNGRSRPRAA